MKLFFILLFFSGIFLILLGYVNQQHQCPAPTVEYRYIPRTFEQDQDNPVRVTQLFDKMFNEPDPFIGNFKINGKAPTNSRINKYFISRS